MVCNNGKSPDAIPDLWWQVHDAEMLRVHRNSISLSNHGDKVGGIGNLLVVKSNHSMKRLAVLDRFNWWCE